ncbi:uncharacterized protein BDZ99DRAFT_225531 [Mytilinidion resinicola]|uniref:Uncharacterized protein n=1 Tax=Mytilinidion resinicola TaxID=574789 RepID=A0A6A6YY12_9PEZI|nr:uncharacterized protein BDZ99DRAFT_225531 [Mytilinidion resinicola]KAF2813812.1 hypothetical protein BDZ99DRAFT_225531 [Mytilinidion resinicola]
MTSSCGGFSSRGLLRERYRGPETRRASYPQHRLRTASFHNQLQTLCVYLSYVAILVFRWSPTTYVRATRLVIFEPRHIPCEMSLICSVRPLCVDFWSTFCSICVSNPSNRQPSRLNERIICVTPTCGSAIFNKPHRWTYLQTSYVRHEWISEKCLSGAKLHWVECTPL